jgi:hypothetical protein
MAGLEPKPIPSSGVEKEERRYKILSLEYSEALDLILATRSAIGGIISIVECDVPKGARVRHVRYDPIFNAIQFLLTHPTWPIIPIGEWPPRIEVKYWHHEIDPDEYKNLKSKTKSVVECPDCAGGSNAKKKCKTCHGKGEVVALILGPAE